MIPHLHDNLRYLAMAKGITIGDLERAMNVSPGYISRKKGLSFESVYKASKVLDVPMEALVEEPLAKQYKIDAIKSEIKRLTEELEVLER